MLEKYYGSDFSEEQFEFIAYTKVAQSHRMNEVELYGSKWFDYRHMHWVNATYLFASLYSRAIKDSFRATRDLFEADLVIPLPHIDVFECTQLITAMNLARQDFDRIGVRYEFGLDFMMKRYNDRGWRFFPRPNQLYQEEAVADLKEAWEDRLEAILELPKHPRFKNHYYVGHPDQDSFHKWIVYQCKLRGKWEFPLSQVLRESFLPEELALQEFGSDTVIKAKRLASMFG